VVHNREKKQKTLAPSLIIHGTSGKLYHSSDGRWSVQFDYGQVAINIPLAQGKGHMSDLEYNQLRYWMAQVEAASRNGDIELQSVMEFLKEAVKALDVSPLKRIIEAIEALKGSRQRFVENERIILSIENVANHLNRVPTKGEVRLYHAEPRPVSDKEPHGYRGQYYEASKWHSKLKAIGFSWLPAGTRGKSRI